MLAIALLPARAIGVGCTAARERQVELLPGTTTEVSLAASSGRLLLEELGADVEYRWPDAEGFVAVETPPGRLGFVVADVRAPKLELRIRQGQGKGYALIDSCLDDAGEQFFSGLAELHTQYLRGGKQAAGVAVALIDALTPLPADAVKRAWLASARANALLSNGRIAESAAAFLVARDAWRVVNRPDRAAIMLMAAGENASRAGRFDEARQQLTLAQRELGSVDAAYFALRSRGALCTVQSRLGRFRDSIDCEQDVVRAMQRRGEDIEAATRHVSIGNQWLRLVDYERAHAEFLQARAQIDQLSPVVRSRLDAGFGTYYLYTGDLPRAAAMFAQASEHLGKQGIPADQALIDFKLASLAGFAGATLERKRLLEQVTTSLTLADASPLLADARLILARLDREQGDPDGALRRLQTVNVQCSKPVNRECIELARQVEFDALMDLGRLDEAQAALDAATESAVGATRNGAALARARLALARGEPRVALRQLPPTSQLVDDPNLRANAARIRSESYAALGDDTEAVAVLSRVLAKQATEAARWPSTALRISARNRLADLQAALFDQLMQRTKDSVDAKTFAHIVRTIDGANAHALFANPSSTRISAALRKELSSLVLGTPNGDLRPMFVAVTESRVAIPERPSLQQRTSAPRQVIGDDHWVLLPIGGIREFALLAWRAGTARVCLRLPIAQYRALVERYERALDGEREDLGALGVQAREWHGAVLACHADAPAASRWTVVLPPGTRPLPWAWIAAATPTATAEPAVELAFGFPTDVDRRLQRPEAMTLLDLDMPNAGTLPFAGRERDALRDIMTRYGISAGVAAGTDLRPDDVLRLLSSGDVVHVIGHANPAAYGQIYQGLWFESERAPTLLTYPEIAAAPSRAGLVVLSSCGTNVAGQAAFGATSQLAEAFIAAGARRVVAASNPLSDTAAPFWTKAFYEALWNDGDVAAAARHARAALRGSPYFRNPKFWAGIDAYVAAGAEVRAAKPRGAPL